MNTERFAPRLSPQEFAALMDDAKRRATARRREAIDDFWSAVADAVRSAWRAMRRTRSTPRSHHPMEN